MDMYLQTQVKSIHDEKSMIVTVGGMLHRRRSYKKKHLQQIISKAVSKL
jgi:hypothetical protein